MYADDTTIYFNIEEFNQHNLQKDITNELERNKLSLNVQNIK